MEIRTIEQSGMTFQLFEKQQTAILKNVSNKEYLKFIEIPTEIKHNDITYTITEIGKECFFEYYNLESVILPKNLLRISDYAFAYTNIKQITLPYTIEVIGFRSFCSTPLEHIQLPNNLNMLDEGVFSDCKKLKKVEVGQNLGIISNYCFSSCRALEEINIPISVMAIGSNAFEYCEKLRDVEIPSSITYIGEEAFFYCISIEKINLPNIPKIGKHIFKGCYNLKQLNNESDKPILDLF
jgi:hypothetical protein